MLFVIVIDRDVQPHRTNAKGPEFSVAVAKERVANCKAKYLLYGERPDGETPSHDTAPLVRDCLGVSLFWLAKCNHECAY